MTWTHSLRADVVAVGVVLILSTAGCDLLDVSDPTAIEDNELNNATGAALLRGDALGDFYREFGSLAQTTGVASDEFTVFTPGATLPSGFTASSMAADLRELSPLSLDPWGTVQRSATVAFEKLERFGPRAHAGEMLALRGQATLRLAANFCPGFPITELEEFTAHVGSPLTTEQAYESALADFDSALTYAADSARVLNFAGMGRAGALLGLGRFSEAASAAQNVPTSYTWTARYLEAAPSRSERNGLVFTDDDVSTYGFIRTIADGEGGSGLDFASADDPRVQRIQYTVADPPMGSGEPMHNPAKYADGGAPIVVVVGLEARLIEAEAALAEGDAAWLVILNDLRAKQVDPALPPLDDPGTPDARLDLLFRERAFWLFATGQRLSDLLRLVRLYRRDPSTVFPAGEYHQHGLTYGTMTSLPFNPATLGLPATVTGCTGT